MERFHDYLETSFLPGRSFASPADFNQQLQGFLVRANTGSIGCWVVGPPIGSMPTGPRCSRCRRCAPVIGWRSSSRLPRDHYMRLDCNDYSVHPSVIGRRVEIIADLHRVRVFSDGRLVADHDRVWAKHQTIHDPEHLAAARAMRRERLEVVHPPAHAEVEIRRLADYDTLLGIDGGVA